MESLPEETSSLVARGVLQEGQSQSRLPKKQMLDPQELGRHSKGLAERASVLVPVEASKELMLCKHSDSPSVNDAFLRFTVMSYDVALPDASVSLEYQKQGTIHSLTGEATGSVLGQADNIDFDAKRPAVKSPTFCREELIVKYDHISKLMDVRVVDGREEFLAHFRGKLTGLPLILARFLCLWELLSVLEEQISTCTVCS